MLHLVQYCRHIYIDKLKNQVESSLFEKNPISPESNSLTLQFCNNIRTKFAVILENRNINMNINNIRKWEY